MDISDWRKRIDKLDAQLVELLNQRSRYAAQVGRLKRKKKLPLHQPEREQEILKRLRRLNRGPLSNAALERLFNRILAESRTVARQPSRADKKP